MGMFTTIVHEGRDYQIKTGFDECDSYAVGDRIPWKPDNYRPGSHIDGVYDSVGGYSNDLDDGPWFIIKDCVIVAAEPRSEEPWNDVGRLEAKYGITDPPKDLWPAYAWKKAQERKERFEAQYEAFKKERNLSDVDAACAFYIHKQLREPSVMDLLFPARKVKE